MARSEQGPTSCQGCPQTVDTDRAVPRGQAHTRTRRNTAKELKKEKRRKEETKSVRCSGGSSTPRLTRVCLQG